MRQPDDQQWEALARLRANPDWRVFAGWLTDCLDEQDIQNRTLSGEELGRGQGRAQCLADILERADKSGDVLKKKRGYSS